MDSYYIGFDSFCSCNMYLNWTWKLLFKDLVFMFCFQFSLCSLDNDFENWNRYAFKMKIDYKCDGWVDWRIWTADNVNSVDICHFIVHYNATWLLNFQLNIMRYHWLSNDTLNVLAFGVFQIQIAERWTQWRHWAQIVEEARTLNTKIPKMQLIPIFRHMHSE